jgi:Fe-S cluster assembly iron-binding protein IscA
VLQLTDTAAGVIRDVVKANAPSEEWGVRIAAQGEDAPATLGLSVQEAPEVEDEVVEEQGARVFLETAAAAALEDKVLDAAVDETGEVRFVLLEQEES